VKDPHQSRVGTNTIASPSVTPSSFTKHRMHRVALFRGRFKSVISHSGNRLGQRGFRADMLIVETYPLVIRRYPGFNPVSWE
jgi:hypothetical protein